MHMAVARGRQRALGPRRQACGQAVVEAVVGPFAGAARRARRLPVPDRRAHARRGAGDPAPRAARTRPSARTGCCATAIPRTPRRPAGSATPTRSSPACAREAVAAGYGQIKLKVGGDLEDDVRRLRIAREACGPDIRIAVDANQRWDVGDAIQWVRALAPFDPYWIEEPTSPDDVLGHAAIRRARGAGQGRHRRARPEPRDLQAADAGRGDRHRPDRRGPGRGGQREPRDPAAGGQVRAARLPARRRRGPVRARPAPLDVRLPRRVRQRWRAA